MMRVRVTCSGLRDCAAVAWRPTLGTNSVDAEDYLAESGWLIVLAHDTVASAVNFDDAGVPHWDVTAVCQICQRRTQAALHTRRHWLAYLHAVPAFGSPHLFRCKPNGHPRCAPYLGGACIADANAVLECPDCSGTAEPFHDSPQCATCSDTGTPRWIEELRG